LKCPLDSLENNGMSLTFLKLLEFHNLNALAVKVRFEGENIANLFFENGINHVLIFSASKLLRIKETG